MTRISAQTLSPITHNSIPVITSELLAQLYGTETIRIQQNHKRNDGRFIEGKHFFKIAGEELKSLRLSLSEPQNSISTKTRSLILWTERGAARHAKMLETDQAWEVFSQLEDFYFNANDGGTSDDILCVKEILDRLTATPERFISAQNGNLITTSLAVAEAFGKEHKHVLEKIQHLNIPDNFASANFSAHVEKIKAGAVIRDSKIYRMTKDGFMLLVMGFNGQKAMAVKIAYINAFNRMAIELEKQKRQNGDVKQKRLIEIAEREAQSHRKLLAVPEYRREAREYVDDVLEGCRYFAEEHNISMKDWQPIDREKAASGLLADLLHNVRAELSFNMKLEPQFRVIPPESLYVNPSDAENMVRIVERGVSPEILSVMLQAGIKRLAAK